MKFCQIVTKNSPKWEKAQITKMEGWGWKMSFYVPYPKGESLQINVCSTWELNSGPPDDQKQRKYTFFGIFILDRFVDRSIKIGLKRHQSQLCK